MIIFNVSYNVIKINHHGTEVKFLIMQFVKISVKKFLMLYINNYTMILELF